MDVVSVVAFLALAAGLIGAYALGYHEGVQEGRWQEWFRKPSKGRNPFGPEQGPR
jgi:hypothetical protein